MSADIAAPRPEVWGINGNANHLPENYSWKRYRLPAQPDGFTDLNYGDQAFWVAGHLATRPVVYAFGATPGWSAWLAAQLADRESLVVVVAAEDKDARALEADRGLSDAVLEGIEAAGQGAELVVGSDRHGHDVDRAAGADQPRRKAHAIAFANEARIERAADGRDGGGA